MGSIKDIPFWERRKGGPVTDVIESRSRLHEEHEEKERQRRESRAYYAKTGRHIDVVEGPEGGSDG